jgi:membrane-bound ClpP family serine protease
MFWLLIAGIVFIGMLFVIAEVLFVPGGILGIVGGLMIIFAIYLPYYYELGMGAHINTLIILAVLTIGLIISVKSKTWRKISLDTDLPSKVRQDSSDLVNIGDKGISISRLTPMGKARFGDQMLEVKSYTGFIDPHTDIEVIDLTKDKIIVKPINIQNESTI